MVAEGGEGGWCARASPVALAHLSLLFVLYGGAMLATSARLKWDPSAYIAVRELLPAEYRVLCALLPLGGLALLALAHLPLAALTAATAHTRRMLYLLFSVCMGVALVAELALVSWAALRVRAWLRSDAARAMHDALEVREHALQLLAALARWHPLPNQIKNLIHESEADLPWNGYVSGAAGGVLLAAQLAALALALRARTAARDNYTLVHSHNGVTNRERMLLDPALR